MENYFGWVVNKDKQIELELVSERSAVYVYITLAELKEMLAELEQANAEAD